MKQIIVLCIIGILFAYATLARQVYAQSNSFPQSAQDHLKQQTEQIHKRLQQFLQRYKPPTTNPCKSGESYVHVYQRVIVNGKTIVKDNVKCQNSNISVSEQIIIKQ